MQPTSLLYPNFQLSPAAADGGGGSPGKLTEDAPGSGGNNSSDALAAGETGGDDDAVLDIREMFNDTSHRVETQQTVVKDGVAVDKTKKVEVESTDTEGKPIPKPASPEEIRKANNEAMERARAGKKAKQQAAISGTKNGEAGVASGDEPRDYTGLDDKDKEYLTKLPNTIFNHVAPLIKERNQLRAQFNTVEGELKKFKENPNRIPDNWFENENAFSLTPEFQAADKLFSRAGQEASHWEAQLVNLKNWDFSRGNASYDSLGYNPQTGQYFVNGHVEITPENRGRAEVELQKALQSAQLIQQNAQQQGLKVQQDFKAQHGQLNNFYNGYEKQFEVLPENLRPVEKEAKAFIDAIHPAHRGTKLAEIASKMFSVILRQGEMLKQLANKEQTKVLNQVDQRAAGPSSGNRSRVGGGSPNRNGDEVDLVELENEMKES